MDGPTDGPRTDPRTGPQTDPRTDPGFGPFGLDFIVCTLRDSGLVAQATLIG